MTDGHKQETRELILEAAERVFGERGFDGARTREIAKRAGVNVAQLHYHFGSKADLYQAVLRNAASRLQSRLLAAVQGEGAPVDRLRRAVRAHFDLLASRRHVVGLLLDALVRRDAFALEFVREVLAPVLGEVVPAVAAGREDGSFRPVPVDQTFISTVALNLIYFVAEPMVTAVVGDEAYEPDALVARREAALDLLLHGLLARPDADPSHADPEET